MAVLSLIRGFPLVSANPGNGVGIGLALFVVILVLGLVFYWDARNRSMDTAELWFVLIAGLTVASLPAGAVAIVGYLAARPSR